ncbi:uncharacterized protein [Dermacentor albipictus]|uniref:uncharacterized protein n=1 Tax=Dermacentor albipictus TaxID=60249 RepID=UPI0038FCFBEE
MIALKIPGEVNFNDLVTLPSRHFDIRTPELYSRYVFQRRNQRPDESISSYAAVLRTLTADCNYGALPPATISTTSPDTLTIASASNPTMPPQDVMLRDRSVYGVWDEHRHQILFTENVLTFNRALDLAISEESVSRHQRGMKGVANAGEIDRTLQIKPGGKHTSARHCYRCDGLHDPQTCKFKVAECCFCSKKDPVERACTSKKKKNTEPRSHNKPQQAHSVNPLPVSESCCKLHTVSVRTHCPKFLVDLRVEEKPVQFEVGTAAACSFIARTRTTEREEKHCVALKRAAPFAYMVG